MSQCQKCISSTENNRTFVYFCNKHSLWPVCTKYGCFSPQTLAWLSYCSEVSLAINNNYSCYCLSPANDKIWPDLWLVFKQTTKTRQSLLGFIVQLVNLLFNCSSWTVITVVYVINIKYRLLLRYITYQS